MKQKRIIRLDAARAAWRQIVDDLEHAPIAEAEKLVHQIREDLGRRWQPRPAGERT